MKPLLLLGILSLAACNEGLTTQIILPQLPDPRPMTSEELFGAQLPAVIRFAEGAPIDPIWAAFEGDVMMTFRAPELDGGPFMDLNIESGLGELTSDCMENAGVGPYSYDLDTGAVTADADLGETNTTVISFSGSMMKTYFYERLEDQVVMGGDGEQITIIEYVVRSQTSGTGTWTFPSLSGSCPALPGPTPGEWEMLFIDPVEDEGGEGGEELSVVSVQHLFLLGEDGSTDASLTTELRAPLEKP